jgi:hypothetical protein
LKSGQQFSLAMAIWDAFCSTSHRLNFLLKCLDPIQYTALQRLRNTVHRKYLFAQALDSIDPLLMEGRAIMWNRQTSLHSDKIDLVKAWVALLVWGAFVKGALVFPGLGLQVSYEPGTIVWLRGHILPHMVEVWEGGQRVSVVHFTHQSLWNECEMECP